MGEAPTGREVTRRCSNRRSGLIICEQSGPIAQFASLGPNVKSATVQEAANADMVILAVPFPVVRQVVSTMSDWRGRIVVDATNAVDVPSFTPTDLGGRLSSEIVAEAVPGARVVKAFNTLYAAVLASTPVQDGGRRVIFTSSDVSRPMPRWPLSASNSGFTLSILARYRRVAACNTSVVRFRR
jgi:predicted dinucleotide-binding enzyme